MTVNIELAETEQATLACYPIVAQLRPHLLEKNFVAKVHKQQKQGYQLAYLVDDNVVAVAGFRLMDNLFSNRILYVDDLVTDENHRSKGYGKKLLDWLKQLAIKEHCQKLELDSGVQRGMAHRFYFAEQLAVSSFHFSIAMNNE